MSDSDYYYNFILGAFDKRIRVYVWIYSCVHVCCVRVRDVVGTAAIVFHIHSEYARATVRTSS